MRHGRFSPGGDVDKIPAEILAAADAAGGGIDWAVSVHSTVNGAHQHVTNLPRDTQRSAELQESRLSLHQGRSLTGGCGHFTGRKKC
jgi:hypothetical protein